MSISAPYIKNADLAGAIAAITPAVKQNPTDLSVRFELAEALLLAGHLDRADNQLDIIMNQDTSWGLVVSMVRHLIRGLVARDEVFAQGRAPEFLTAPTPTMEALLKAGQAVRKNDMTTALHLCEEAEAARPKLTGKCNDIAFDDFRDGDDLTAGVFEVLTSTGKYFWIAAETVISIEFQPIEKPRDLILRPVEMNVVDGPEGVVFLPAAYWRPKDQMTDSERLGHSTEWHEGNGPTTGIGQRCFLVGEESMSISELRLITFEQG
jgi:type VI secretion system protein ImpE